MSKIKLAVAAIAAVTLVGCQPPNVKLDSITSQVTGVGIDRTENLEAPFLEQIAPEFKPAEEPMASAQSDLALRKANQFKADIPALQEYANQVLDRLIEAWPGEKPDVSVVLVSDENYRAVTFTQERVIVLSIGTFNTMLKTEDQLAALLAHELSHILAGHNVKDGLNTFVSKVSVMGEMFAGTDKKVTADLSNDYTRTKMATWATENLLFPSWNRGQENEADALATDLLVLAGYHPRAMTKVINSLEKTAQARKSFVEQNVEVMNQKMEDETILNEDPLMLIASGIGAELKDKYGQEYDSYKERKENVIGYTKSFYKDEYRKATYDKESIPAVMNSEEVKTALADYLLIMEAEQSLMDGDNDAALNRAKKVLQGPQSDDPYVRYVSYQIHKDRKEYSKAVEVLATTFSNDTATLSMHAALADLALKVGLNELALEALLMADDLFEQPEGLLPSLITASVRNGKNPGVYKMRCVASMNKDLWAQCSQAERL